MFLIWSLFGSSLTGTERIILSSLSGAVLLNFYRWKKTPTAESFSFKKTIAYYWPTYSEVVRPETCTPILRDDGAFCFPENTNTRLALSVYKEYLRSIGMKVAKKDTRTRSLSKEARLVYEFSVVGEDGVKLIGEVVFFIKGKNTTIAFGLKS